MKKVAFALSAVLLGAAVPAQAAVSISPAACSTADLTPGAQACVGFERGNLTAAGGPTVAEQRDALALLGYNWNGVQVEKITNLNGTQTINFATLLRGISYVSIHFGNGRGGPGNGTAFYRLDAGNGLDSFTTAYRASSSAVLYGMVAAVPEPSTWAMMIVGFGLVGAAARRQRRTGLATAR